MIIFYNAMHDKISELMKKKNGDVGDHIFIIILDDEIVIELNLNKFPRDI